MKGVNSGGLVASPETVTFGSLPIGQTASIQVSLLNLGLASVVISQINVTGDSFSLSGQSKLPFIIPSAGTYAFNVQFDPVSAGTATGQLTIISSSSTNGTTVIGLSGTGASTTPTLSIGATSREFGDGALNTAATQSVVLTSTGTEAVTVQVPVATGPGFTTLGGTFPVTLNPNQTVMLNVQFDPTVAGAATGKLTITSNSSSNGTEVISLSGMGVATAFAIDLSWDPPGSSSDRIVGYKVYRSTSNSSAYQLLNVLVDAQTIYIDDTVQAGLTYDYIVKSVDAFGVESAPSNVYGVTIP
jgi:hypothetical protein